jgi:alpha-mannosidase
MDQGVHEIRFLVTAGEAEKVRRSVASFADWLSGPPFALAHLPFGDMTFHGDTRQAESGGSSGNDLATDAPEDVLGQPLLFLEPAHIRLTACKPSWDGKALVLRLHETSGRVTSARLTIHLPLRVIDLSFKPFEVKTLRIERSGAWREADLISET